jgi:phosphoribosylamine--glycine ligase
VVIKPTGLTGGKGVKVVGPHLRDNDAAYEYGSSIILSGHTGGAVIVEERLDAPEFTIQAMTDGKKVVFPPATYDYPYRYDGDTGPGTGGMGSYSMTGGLLPFLDKSTYEHACQITEDAIHYLARDGRHFTGCMNAGFFATEEGPKVIEFNSRFGDPEGLNIMTLFEGDWADVMYAMYHGELNDLLIPLARESSVVVYLVSPEYALRQGSPHQFSLDVDQASAAGVSVYFSSACEESPGQFVTVGTSRAVAFATRAPALTDAREKAYGVIGSVVDGPLEYRKDIALV